MLMLNRNIEANSGSVALGDNAQNNNICINNLSTIKQAMREVDTESQDTIKRLTNELELNKGAVNNFLRIINHQQIDDENLVATFRDIATQHNKALSSFSVLYGDDKENNKQLNIIETSIVEGRYADAISLSNLIIDAELIKLKHAESLETKAKDIKEQKILKISQLGGKIAELYILDSNYLSGAAEFEKIMKILPTSKLDWQMETRFHIAYCYKSHSLLNSDLATGMKAVNLYKEVLSLYGSVVSNIGLKKIFSWLGNTLNELGQLTQNVVLLREAIEYQNKLPILKPKNDSSRSNLAAIINVANSYSCIASMTSDLDSFQSANKMYESVLTDNSMSESFNNTVSLNYANNLMEIGLMENKTQLVDISIEKLNQCEAFFKKENDTRMCEIIEQSLSVAHRYLGIIANK